MKEINWIEAMQDIAIGSGFGRHDWWLYEDRVQFGSTAYPRSFCVNFSSDILSEIDRSIETRDEDLSDALERIDEV